MTQNLSKSPAIFEEEQRVTQWWVWAIVFVVAAAGIASAHWTWRMQFVLHRQWANHPSSDTEAIVFMVAMVLAGLLPLALIRYIRLRVRVEQDSLTFTYRPFIRKRYPMDRIATAEARQYHPLIEYWGWGIRLSITGRGWCYTVSGDEGVQVTLINGKTFLIGSRRAGELAGAIRRAKP